MAPEPDTQRLLMSTSNPGRSFVSLRNSGLLLALPLIVVGAFVVGGLLAAADAVHEWRKELGR